jgi:hypothetical protein
LIKKNFYESEYYNKLQNKFNVANRVDEKSEYTFKSKISYRSFKNTGKYGKSLQSQSINLFTDDFFINPSTTNLTNFLFFNNYSFIDNLEESYENLKNIKSLNFFDYKNTNFAAFNGSSPLSYTTVLDSFRSNFEENQ